MLEAWTERNLTEGAPVEPIPSTIHALSGMLPVAVHAVEVSLDMIRIVVSGEEDGELFAATLCASGVNAFYMYGRYTRQHKVCIPV